MNSLHSILSSPRIVIDPFCLRQFLPSSSSSSSSHIPIPCNVNEFVTTINQYITQQFQQSQSIDNIYKPGYAPFCKHIFIKNWLSIPSSSIPIDENNKHLLVSSYVARTPQELPVLQRNFPKEKVSAPTALYLDIILYSREQILKENEAMKSQPLLSSPDSSMQNLISSIHKQYLSSTDHQYEYGIVSIKPQMIDYEIPMNPITMMRNALGVNEGGSGVPLDRSAYMKSVAYWDSHALIA